MISPEEKQRDGEWKDEQELLGYTPVKNGQGIPFRENRK
jgi:hypothetical protein